MCSRVYVCTVCLQGPADFRGGIECLGSGLTDSCILPRVSTTEPESSAKNGKHSC